MSTPVPIQQSNIRVFVQWTEQTVFAGEDIECQITFKNVATVPAPRTSSLHPSSAKSFTPASQRKPPTAQLKSPSPLSPRPGLVGRGHRSTLSLTVAAGSLRSQPPTTPWPIAHPKSARGQHKRSVSIISIGTTEGGQDDTTSHGSLAERTRGPSRGHGRSASLQIVPRRYGSSVNGGPTTAPISQRSSTHPSPLFTFPPVPVSSVPERPVRRHGSVTAPSTPGLSGGQFISRKDSGSLTQGFEFPVVSSPVVESRLQDHSNGNDGHNESRENEKLLQPRPRDTTPTLLHKPVPATRILSPASTAGTPRSSGEFYSLSTNSTETLASEYVPHHPSRVASYNPHIRKPSNLSPVNHRPPEALMMGYAQVHGSFTLDGSLISQSPFEEVKKKGAVGGQGGGVVGVESSKRDSGLLRGFGWGSIGGSIGGLLGGGELSSIKDMRGIASSRSIPLLSTPQSILFVDLHLAPGESKTYKYTFKLPRGLPPTHRGKAIKISYKLVIGTQRPGGAKEQQVKSVEVPFRVLGSVNSNGELLGHDLMAPYIILRDQARVGTIEDSLESSQELKTKKSTKPDDSTLDDFLSYVDELLTRPRRNSSLGLLSPTEAPRSRRQSSAEEPSSAKEAIDMAILRSNISTESQQSANRFEIARSRKRVAVIMLARPAYRLGETITAAIDFTNAEIPCYAIHASLETSEKVDNSLALRSEASILRVTRKVHVSHSESTLFARRVVFSPTIPVSATPEFITSGVSLDWRIRIEFVTPQLATYGSELMENYTDLLEEISRDDRGVVLAASEFLDCETFEIAVPLRVYGALAGNAEKDDAPLDGLVV